MLSSETNSKKSDTDPKQWPRAYTGNHVILQNPENPKEFFCSACGRHIGSRPGASSHSQSAHQMDIYGNAIKAKTKKGEDAPKVESPTSEIPDSDLEINDTDDEFTRNLKAALKKTREIQAVQKTQDSGPNLDQLADFVATESSKEIASQAVKIVTDSNLMFVYHKSRRLFPPTFSLADTLSACFAYTMEKRFGLDIKVNFNISKADQETQEYLIGVDKLWSEYLKASGVAVEASAQGTGGPL